MDLFDAYPALKAIQHYTLDNKDLRLISISGFVYDKESLYFELNSERYWGRLPAGTSVIGVGLPKVKPDGIHPPYRTLMQSLRTKWRCDTDLFPAGYTFVIDEKSNVSLFSGGDMPFIMQMTLPRLGGANVPDALVQAVYLLPVHRFHWRNASLRVNLLKISRSSFTDFLAQETWASDELFAQTWSELKTQSPLPEDSVLRLILTLRSIRELLRTEEINLDLLLAS